MIRFVISIVLLFSFSVYAQLSKEQVQLVQKVDFKDHSFDPRKPKFLSADKGFLIKYNPINLT
ncbi:MAG: hypothetical protein ACK4ON_06930, partial [Bacteroidia bacterium]